ncbi:MAG: hypothetical protein KBC53_01390 [Nitrosomonas sp.]|jgi:hypothetical protein|nr:hypothetical protein [Nitrosomonas sp.]
MSCNNAFEQPTNPVTCYFFDYWEDLWTGISSKRDLLTSFNPRVVIRELLDEITLNKVYNKSNEAFFKRTLSNYLKSDPGSSRRLKLYLQMILKEIDLSKRRPHYLPKLCVTALKIFDNFEYIEDCIDSLIELTKATEATRCSIAEKNRIKHIVNHLIVEFREVGYADEEIRNFHQWIFSKIQYVENLVNWPFPHQYSCENADNEIELKRYKQELEDFQLTLTEEIRIRALLTLAKKNKEPIRYIFGVTGMTGVTELEVANTLFYSPKIKPLMCPNKYWDPKNDLEYFNNKKDDQSINASVIVDVISPISGEMIARSKVEKTFALCRRIMKGGRRLRISKSHLALDINGKLKVTSKKNSHDIDDDPINLDDLNSVTKSWLVKIEEVKRIAEENGWGRRFNESCYWLKRAAESDLYVDKLLSYWICIETLCAKSENDTANWFAINDGQRETDIFLIKEIVGKMRAVGKCYEHGWMLHNQLSSPFLKFKNITIPETLKNKAQLQAKEGEKVLLKNLVECSEDIKEVIPEGLLKEQLEDLHNFYTDKSFALSTLHNHLETTQDELAFIYRMRNKIAHDGSSEHPLLPPLCKISAEYANFFFNKIVQTVAAKKELELRSVLIRDVQDYDLIEFRLKTEEPTDIFLKKD